MKKLVLFMIFLIAIGCSGGGSSGGNGGSIGDDGNGGGNVVPEFSAGTPTCDNENFANYTHFERYTGVTQADVDEYKLILEQAGFKFDPVNAMYVKTINGKIYLITLRFEQVKPGELGFEQLVVIDGNNSKIDFAPEFNDGTLSVTYDSYDFYHRARYTGVAQADVDAYKLRLEASLVLLHEKYYPKTAYEEYYEKTENDKLHWVFLYFERYNPVELEISQTMRAFSDNRSEVDFAPGFSAGTFGVVDRGYDFRHSELYTDVTQADIDAYESRLVQDGFQRTAAGYYEKNANNKHYVVQTTFGLKYPGGFAIYQIISEKY